MPRLSAARIGLAACEGSFVAGSTTQSCNLAGSTLPVIEHAHGDGWFAIIGGYVVRDPSLPSLAGRYVYSDNAVGELYSARLALPRAQDDGPVGIPVPGASSFGEDTAGCVYVAQLGGPVSAWSRTRPASPAPDPPARARFRARRRVRPSA